MDIKQLEYFMVIVEEGQITRAATRLHMAQPPLSRQLKLLEDELKVTLIERVANKFEITEEGRLLEPRAREILELVSRTTEEVSEVNQGIRGALSVGTLASIGSERLPQRVLHFRLNSLKFRILEGDTNRIMELVQTRVVDLGIVRLPVDRDIFEVIDSSFAPLGSEFFLDRTG